MTYQITWCVTWYVILQSISCTVEWGTRVSYKEVSPGASESWEQISGTWGAVLCLPQVLPDWWLHSKAAMSTQSKLLHFNLGSQSILMNISI